MVREHRPLFEDAKEIVQRRKQQQSADAQREEQPSESLRRRGGSVDRQVWRDEVGKLRERPGPDEQRDVGDDAESGPSKPVMP